MSKLTCVKGNNKGDDFALHEGKNIIGRSNECKVPLFDKQCSRQHCQVIKKGEHYSIQDLDSSNGTRLNGKEVGPNAKTLELNDTIELGGTGLILSDKSVGSAIDQAATDVAADLQSGKYGDLLSSTSRAMRNKHPQQKSAKGLKGFFKSLFGKK
ncbi:MAG: FHA domain-containing protein [Lentisphaeria bacterium]